MTPSGSSGGDRSLGALGAGVERRLDLFQQQDIVRRLWEHDHTIWKPEPTEITNRLGWLTVADQMLGDVDDLRRFAEQIAGEGCRTAVLLGMGGSSLAPEVLHSTFGAASGFLKLTVLDTTDPTTIQGVERSIDLKRTLFIVASKSGTTIETLSHLAYFWDKLADGGHFVAITDPGSPLQKLGEERTFRRVFLNPADIGGRYSALSYFGLVPAALVGVDVGQLLDRARNTARACDQRVPPAENPGARLGAALGEGALAGRDKATLVLPDEISTLGYWIEQLIAESTGKEGKGILPVEGEPLAPPELYGRDRLFVATGEHDGLAALETAGHPVVRLPYDGPVQLGAEFFRWEFATALAGHVLGINPFDQPNVQEAKDATARILERGGGQSAPETARLSEVLESIHPGDYVAIQAYLPRTSEVETELQAARLKLRERYQVATTIGYGPRFLHSTGQLHKGGPDSGLFIQVVGEDTVDLDVPGKPFTFGELKRAQALGDLESLRARDRRVTRVTLDELQGV